MAAGMQFHRPYNRLIPRKRQGKRPPDEYYAYATPKQCVIKLLFYATQ